MNFTEIKSRITEHPIALTTFAFSVVSGLILFITHRKQALNVGKKVVDKIRSVLGTPYIWGSRDPSVGLDCSGAVVWALRELGFEPKGFNATAADLHNISSSVIFPQPGDLAFYGPSGKVDHVMVYAGDNNVIGASGGGPSTTTVEKALAKNAQVKILPVNYRKDFISWGRLPIQSIT